MRVFLDTNIVIYLVERTPGLSERVRVRLDALRSAGDSLVVSELVRMEARIGPLRDHNRILLAEFDAWFDGQEVTVVGLTRSTFDRAADIRAQYGYRALDALHLAAAVEAGCEVFLTNDGRLAGFEGLRVEVLGAG